MTGSQLRYRRERSKISLRALASRMGISASYLCDLELGRRSSTEQLAMADRVLRVMIAERQ
jgi:transcriptional regulator with XRE-family HTH domain